MSKLAEISVGAKFGKWTVIHATEYQSEEEGLRRQVNLCVCECGLTRHVLTNCLRNGGTSQCYGCRQLETMGTDHWEQRLLQEACPNYAVRRRLLHRIANIHRRCSDTRGHNYHCYGGRGITVHKSLLNKVDFLRYLCSLPGHDDPSLTIDRRDNDRGYEPGNLRFVGMKVQIANRRPRSSWTGRDRCRDGNVS